MMTKPDDSAGPFFTHLSPRDTPYRNRDVVMCLSSVIERVLGPSGRLLSYSKTAYRREHPQALFNACLFMGEDEKAVEVWFGDVDLEIDRERLQEAADLVGRRLVLTSEQPARFGGLAAALEENDTRYIHVFEPTPGHAGGLGRDA